MQLLKGPDLEHFTIWEPNLERKVERKKRKDLHMAGFETYNLQIVGPALRPWLVTHCP